MIYLAFPLVSRKGKEGDSKQEDVVRKEALKCLFIRKRSAASLLCAFLLLWLSLSYEAMTVFHNKLNSVLGKVNPLDVLNRMGYKETGKFSDCTLEFFLVDFKFYFIFPFVV